MSEWNEKMLDEELEAIMNDVPEQEDLEKKINQIINRRIRKIVMKTLSAVAIVALVLCLGISPLMNAVCWNPYKMNENGENSELFTVMGNYIELTQPWNELISVDVEKKGFARYEIEMQISDHTESLYIGIPNVKCIVKSGNYTSISDPDGMMAMRLGRFNVIDWGVNDTTIEDIEELPESAWLYLDLSSKEVKTVEELSKAKPGVAVEWIQVHQPGAEFQGGIRLIPSGGVSDPKDAPWAMSGEELLELYLSNLENLLEHPEAWGKLQLCDGRNSVYVQGLEVLRDTYENAKELTTVTTKNYCISGQRDEVLEYLKANEFTDIRIEEVKLSIYE